MRSNELPRSLVPFADKANPIPADLADWTQAPFPVITRQGGDTWVVLLGAVGGLVIGASEYGSANDWAGNGSFCKSEGRGKYPTMDLPIPPAAAEAERERVAEQIRAIEARLAANPDAPQEWRQADEAKLAQLEKALNTTNAIPEWTLPEAPADDGVQF